MEKNFFVTNQFAGLVSIHRLTGALNWAQKNLDPVVQRYVKKYLFDEGFIEKALGLLDPPLDSELPDLFEGLQDLDFQ